MGCLGVGHAVYCSIGKASQSKDMLVNVCNRGVTV